MGRGYWVFAALIAMTAHIAVAQSSEGAATEPASSSSSNSTGEDKIIDAVKQKKYEQSEKITDMELNAQTGSLSRYSMQAYLGYSGPAINNLTSTDQPNPLNKRVPSQTDVSGSVGVRYRMSSDDSIYASTGIEGYFQPNGQKNPDLENPAIEYDHSYKVGAVQMVTGVEAVKSTMSYYVGEGETAGAELKQFMKWNVPNSRFILGTELEAEEWFYDRDYRHSDGKGITDTIFNLIPSVEYRILHNLNFNTSYSTGWTHYRGTEATNTYSGYPGSWWVGIGYGITRDIYIKPYISFYPQAMTWSNTAVALTTYISVF
jgi:hypothetical protein